MEKENKDLSRYYDEKKERQRQVCLKLASRGVEFANLDTVYIEDNVVIGEGTFVGLNVVIEQGAVVGKNCKILAGSIIIASDIGDGTSVVNSMILNSSIGKGSNIGPFAYIRPDSKIGSKVKIGDFVEIKNATIGDGTKISHLTYVGDADIGESVNLGCGVVFVNYDGEKKSRSTVESKSFIGCNSNIIAPVSLGEGTYVAAGTTVTKDAPAGSFVIGRVKQETKLGLASKLRARLKKGK